MADRSGRGEISVREAGRRGGRKGGEVTSRTHGPEFYEKIGKKGGETVRRLVREGKSKER